MCDTKLIKPDDVRFSLSDGHGAGGVALVPLNTLIYLLTYLLTCHANVPLSDGEQTELCFQQYRVPN